MDTLHQGIELYGPHDGIIHPCLATSQAGDLASWPFQLALPPSDYTPSTQTHHTMQRGLSTIRV
jgi:hypothetical protein